MTEETNTPTGRTGRPKVGRTSAKRLVAFRFDDEQREELRAFAQSGESDGLAAKRLLLEYLSMLREGSSE